jgi:hypothetical protein
MSSARKDWLIATFVVFAFLIGCSKISPEDCEHTTETQQAVTALGEEARMSYPLATHCAVEPDGVEICTQTERNLK